MIGNTANACCASDGSAFVDPGDAVALPNGNIREVVHTCQHIIPPEYREGWNDETKAAISKAFADSNINLLGFEQDKFTGKSFAKIEIAGIEFKLFEP